MSNQQNKSNAKGTQVAVLGDSDVFFRRDKNGVIRPFWKIVQLQENVHYIKLPGTGKHEITVEGYTHMNLVANINLLQPPHFIVEGKQMPNPWATYLKGILQRITVRFIGYGYAPTGNPMIIDKTIIFDLKTYLLQDLTSKIKKYPACGCFGTSTQKPTEWQAKKVIWSNQKKTESVVTAKPSETANLIFLPTEPIDDTLEIGIWIDMNHPEIQAAFQEQNQRRKFGQRSAQSICSKNVLKSFPNIGVTNISKCIDDKKKVATVTVYGYRHELGTTDITESGAAAAAGDYEKVQDIAGSARVKVEVSEPEVADFEEVDVETQAAVQEEQAEKEKEKKTRRGRKKKEDAPEKSSPAEQAPVEESPPAEQPPAEKEEKREQLTDRQFEKRSDDYIPPGGKAPEAQQQSFDSTKPPGEPAHIKALDEIAAKITKDCEDNRGPMNGEKLLNDLSLRLFSATSYKILQPHHASNLLRQGEAAYENFKKKEQNND